MRRRFLLAFIGVMIVMLLAHDVPLALFVRAVERDRLIASLERDAFVIAGAAEDLLSEGDGADAELLGRTVELYQQRDGARVVVVDAQAVAVAVSDTSGAVGENYANRPEITAALGGEPVEGNRFSNTLGGDLVYVAVPVRSGPDIVGAVRITFDADVIAERSNDTIGGIVLVAVISLVGAALTAVFLASSVTRPVVDLQRTTERLASGDLSVRADEAEGPPEVRQLAASFNTMTQRLSELLDKQRSFASDASHQLRTPLTALRLQLEMATDALATDPERAHHRLEAAAMEVERLQRIIEGLLVLARAERTRAATEVVDVSAVIAARHAMWEPLAAEQDITIAIPADGAAALALAVPQGLDQMLDALLDNALGVAPGGSTIDITVETHHTESGPAVTVHVLDRGPGIAPEHLAHATDRFWRSPDASYQGTGLGLAIVDQLAHASGGHLTLTNRDGGGLDASITLPGT